MAAALAVTIGVAGAPAAEQQVVKIGVLKTNAPKDVIRNSLTGALIVNPSARMGYQVFETASKVETRLRVIDLDTFRAKGEIVIPEQIAPATRPAPAEYLYALDAERNFLYFPILRGALFEGVVVVDGNRRRVAKTFLRRDATDPTAALKIDEDDKDIHPCTAQSCLPQVPGAAPAILGVDFVPSFLTGGNPKILMLWGEPNVPPMELNSNVGWVAQWDAITGRQDFAYQIRSCMNREFPKTDLSHFSLAIFQARLGSGIYLGCNASGGTGQVVRIVLNANGQPDREETFPGPTNVSDVLADKEDDRLLFRVNNEAGESYWVFNGTASSYSGVVGVTIAPAATSVGLDPDSGRAYFLAPVNAAGRQRSAGGLLMSDIRRAPAPQALSFPQFAAKGFLKIEVDHRAPNGTRRVFVRPAGLEDYVILQDNVPITTDAPLTDLDRFTTDVDEKPGVTDANYTGTGHAYGMRTLLVGGLEGVPPVGADLSGIRVGRFVPRQLGSPCMGGDRHLTIGAVQEAQLSNNITNAAATASETDAGSVTDARQPTERCYPKPRLEAGNYGELDPFSPLYPYTGGYPRPLDRDSDADGTSDSDERAGSDWPFEIAQCASEGRSEKKTRVRPLARGDEVPKEHRDHEVQPGGYRAQVRCELAKQFVHATAEARNYEQTGVPVKGLDFIRAAETSSSSHVFRAPTGGLVSRSEAFVRGINIANRVFIDKAYTFAEARAAGRPGTAATAFVRALCGVRIPELNLLVDVIDQDLPPQHVGDPAGDAGRTLLPGGLDLPHDRSEIPNHIDPPSADLGDVDPLNPDSDDQVVNDRFTRDLCGEGAVATQLGSQPVIDAINRVLGSRGRVSLPQPDTELRQGSPGGYLASIQKDRQQQIGARSVQNDDSTQVPALEIVIFNDDPTAGRGRQVYQFAGVDASATYGIFLLNPEEEDFNLPEELVEHTNGGIGGGPAVPTGSFGEGTPPPSGGGAAPVPVAGGPFTIVYHGIGFLLRSPKDAVLAAAVWLLLFAPVQLVARRRALKLLG